MRSFYFALAVLLLAGCNHKVHVDNQDVNLKPMESDISVGPTHKRIEIANGKGKRKWNIDVYEDEKKFNIQRQQQDIELRNR